MYKIFSSALLFISFVYYCNIFYVKVFEFIDNMFIYSEVCMLLLHVVQFMCGLFILNSYSGLYYLLC